MIHLTAVEIAGYRAISEPLRLEGLGPYVPLYGDNAVGKSSVLLAIELLGRLCATPAVELVGGDGLWPEDSFFDSFEQDRWMFNDRSDGVVRLWAKTSDGRSVGFEITQRPPDVWVACVVVGDASGNALAAFRSAYDEVEQVKYGEESWDDLVLLHAAEDRQLQAATRIDEVFSAVRVALAPSPRLPVPDELREQVFGAFSSADARKRAQLRRAFQGFRELFPALGEGAVEVLQNPPDHEKDLAWVTDDVTIPLDRLGGGVQSAVSTFGQLLLTEAAVVCLEEPEAFVGAAALAPLATALHDAPARGVCGQVWLATHAVTLAHPTDRVWVLERQDGVVRARQAPTSELGRFAQEADPVSADRLGRLGDDGSVRLPKAMVERLGLRSGDFVYFRDDGNVIEVLSGEALEARLGGSDT